MSKTYTQEQLDIEIIKHDLDNNVRHFDHLYRLINRVENQLYWILGVMGTGFIGLLGLMAHGFKWVK